MAMPSLSSRGRPVSRDVKIWPLVMVRHLPSRGQRNLHHHHLFLPDRPDGRGARTLHRILASQPG